MNQTTVLLPCITIFFLMLRTCRSQDTIAVHQNISDGETIVSGNAKFELGFFSLGSSKDRYLGIWFKNTSPQAVVWVANREIPLIDNSGMVKLDDQGNLTLVNGSGKVIWSSNSLASGLNTNLVAQLLDTGNLVIKNETEILIWQSFDHPGDTYLPGMKVGKNFITGRETYLTSWRSADDPSPDKFPNPELMPITTIPVDYCDNYGVCGSYGSCSIATSPFCGCLKGFERKTTISDETSADHNDTSVCRRSIALDCGPGEGFLKFSSMKLPDTENAVFSGNMSLKDCEVACNNNCSCTAYANPNITQGGVGCLLWFGGLIDVRVYSQNGQDLYVRLAASELSDIRSRFDRKKRVVMVVTLSISALLTLLGFILAIYIRRKWKKSSDAGSSNHMGSVEVPLFGLSKISRATNDFSVDNKLGEGGFGPVYKMNQGSRYLIGHNASA